MLGSLGRNVVASVVNALAVLVSALVAVPFILAAVGTAGYGVWTLGLAVVLYASVAETGLGPSVLRFTAVARGAGDETELRQLLWTTLATYAVVAGLGWLALRLAAPALVGLFDLPARLRPDAQRMFETLGWALALALLAAGSGAFLQGVERFGSLAVSSAAGATAFLVGVLALADSRGLPGLATALALQHGTVLATRVWALRRVALGSRPSLLALPKLGRMISFAVRLQVTALSEFVNWQSDKVVVGLVAPVTTVGQLGIGAQFADGGRLLATAALGPVISSFAGSAGAGDQHRLQRRFLELHRLWVLGVLGCAVIGAASLRPLIESWVGPGYHRAALLGAFLVLGSAAGLATGSGVAYMRAIGRPGLEARYGVVVVLANLVLTIPLAIVAGALGVVIGTLGAYLLGSAFFFSRLRPWVPGPPVNDRRDAARALGSALAGGAAAFAWGELAVSLLPVRVSLVFVALGALAALAAYLSAALGLRPTPRNLRRWLADAPA